MIETRVISDELRRVSTYLSNAVKTIEALANRTAGGRLEHFTIDQIRANSDLLASLALSEHRSRRLRETYIGCHLFGEPSWDLLLDLFAHTIKGKQVPTSSAYIAAHCPSTTALRYIKALENEGLVEGHANEGDARYRMLELTDDAIVSVGSYLMILAGLGSAEAA